MNERIRELAEKADMVRILDEHAHEYGNGMFDNTPYPELEKLVELVVRECCEIADEVEQSDQLFKVSKFIKIHFGVKE